MKTLALSDQISFLSPIVSAEGGSPARAADAGVLPERHDAFATILVESSPLSEGFTDTAPTPAESPQGAEPSFKTAAGPPELARPTAESAIAASMQMALQTLPATTDAAPTIPDMSAETFADNSATTVAPVMPHWEKLPAADAAALQAPAPLKDPLDKPKDTATAETRDTPPQGKPPRPAAEAADTGPVATAPLPVDGLPSVAPPTGADAVTKAAQTFVPVAALAEPKPLAIPGEQVAQPATARGAATAELGRQHPAGSQNAATVKIDPPPPRGLHPANKKGVGTVKVAQPQPEPPHAQMQAAGTVKLGQPQPEPPHAQMQAAGMLKVDQPQPEPLHAQMQTAGMVKIAQPQQEPLHAQMQTAGMVKVAQPQQEPLHAHMQTAGMVKVAQPQQEPLHAQMQTAGMVKIDQPQQIVVPASTESTDSVEIDRPRQAVQVPPEVLPLTESKRGAQENTPVVRAEGAEMSPLPLAETGRPVVIEPTETEAAQPASVSPGPRSKAPAETIGNAESPSGASVAPVIPPHIPVATSGQATQTAAVTGVAAAQTQQAWAAQMAPQQKAESERNTSLKTSVAATAPESGTHAAETGQAQRTAQPVKAAETTPQVSTVGPVLQAMSAPDLSIRTVARPAAEIPTATAIPTKVSLAESRIQAAMMTKPVDVVEEPEQAVLPTTTPAQDKAGAAAPPVAAAPQTVPSAAPAPIAATPMQEARVSDSPKPKPIRDRADPPSQAAAAETAVKTAETVASAPATTLDGPAPSSSGAALSFTTVGATERTAAHLVGGHDAAAQAHRAASPHAIAHQMSQALADAGNRTVELTLSPEELGKVRMTLTSNDGAIIVTVQAERPETLDLMRRNIDSLARDFRDMGYSNIGFDFGQQSGQRQSAQERAAESALQQLTPDRDGIARFDASPITLQSSPRTGSGGLDLRI